MAKRGTEKWKQEQFEKKTANYLKNSDEFKGADKFPRRRKKK